MQLPLESTKFEKLAKECQVYDVKYLFIPNYISSSYSSHPINKTLKPIFDEVLEYITILSKEEFENLINSYSWFYKERVTDSSEEIKFEQAASSYIVEQLFKIKSSIKEIINYDIKDSIVLKTFPELESLLDERSRLLKLTDAFEILDNGIVYKNHFLFPHQFLRKQFTNSLNSNFLSQFFRYYLETKNFNTFEIAIDFFRLIPIEHYQTVRELDHWFGAKFNTNDLDNPSKIGVTIIGRKPSRILDLTNKLIRTEFFWGLQNKIKVFEVEEISKEDQLYQNYILNRHVHSERDIDLKNLRHFDGAIKIYHQSDYKERFESKFPDVPKNYKKIKLFKIDGNIDLQIWINLISSFFLNNEMVLEYFDPELYNQNFSNLI